MLAMEKSECDRISVGEKQNSEEERASILERKRQGQTEQAVGDSPGSVRESAEPGHGSLRKRPADQGEAQKEKKMRTGQDQTRRVTRAAYRNAVRTLCARLTRIDYDKAIVIFFHHPVSLVLLKDA
jgi:hypothetical protein